MNGENKKCKYKCNSLLTTKFFFCNSTPGRSRSTCWVFKFLQTQQEKNYLPGCGLQEDFYSLNGVCSAAGEYDLVLSRYY